MFSQHWSSVELIGGPPLSPNDAVNYANGNYGRQDDDQHNDSNGREDGGQRGRLRCYIVRVAGVIRVGGGIDNTGSGCHMAPTGIA